MADAIYAAGAKHGRHVIAGMQRCGLQTLDIGRYVPNRLVTGLARSGVLSSTVRQQILTRSQTPGRRADETAWLGVGELLLPGMMQAGVRIPPRVRRAVYHAQSRKLRAAIRRQRPRVVQFTDGLGASLRAAELQTTLMVCERRSLHQDGFLGGLEIFLDFPFVPLLEDPIDEILQHDYQVSDLIVVYSTYAAQTFRDAGVSPDKLVCVPLPVGQALATVHLGSEARQPLAFVGRAEAMKGLDVAAAAARLAGVPLTVAGPARTDVQSWMAAQSHITYLGVLGEEALNELYRSTVIVISPSRESFGLVPVEAIRWGALPLVSDEVGVADRLSLAHHGLVVTGRDPAAYAGAIDGFLRMPAASRAEILRAVARVGATELSFDRVVQLWMDQVGSVVAARG